MAQTLLMQQTRTNVITIMNTPYTARVTTARFRTVEKYSSTGAQKAKDFEDIERAGGKNSHIQRHQWCKIETEGYAVALRSGPLHKAKMRMYLRLHRVSFLP